MKQLVTDTKSVVLYRNEEREKEAAKGRDVRIYRGGRGAGTRSYLGGRRSVARSARYLIIARYVCPKHRVQIYG